MALKRSVGGVQRLFLVLGKLTALIIALSVGAAVVRWFTSKHVPGKTVLELDLDASYAEHVPDEGVESLLFREAPRFRNLIDAVRKAAGDSRVKGIVARGGNVRMGIGQVQEFRDALTAFRSAGKPAVLYAETFGELSPANVSYYLASAFEKIYLQPSGELGLTGFVSFTPFYKSTLDKVGVQPQIDHRKEYKSAKNILTETEYTPAHRAAVEAMLTSLSSQMLGAVSRERNIDSAQVPALIDRGPFSAAGALENNLIDDTLYRDEVYEGLTQRLGKDIEYLSAGEYLDRGGKRHEDGTTIALIYGVGSIYRGRSRESFLNGEMMGSETVTRAFRKAVDESEVKGILFRIESPGGSYVASDEIRRGVARAGQAGKPVVVSMANVAASGGYFIALPASAVVAQPGCLTGSIGVVAGKAVTRGLWNKLGVTWDNVNTAANADFWSPIAAYDSSQWNRLQEFLDKVYNDFTAEVAAARELPPDSVLSIARGRVWTGADAFRLGLVDTLGGMETALAMLRREVGIAPDAAVHLKIFPRPRPLLERILDRNRPRSQEAVDLVRASTVLRRAAAELGLTGTPGVMRAQELPQPR